MEREDVQPEEEVPADQGDSLADVQDFLERGQELVSEAQEMRLLGWIGMPMQIGVSLWLLLLGSGLALVKPWQMWLFVGLGVALAGIILQRYVLVGMIRNRIWESAEELAVLLIQAQELADDLLAHAVASSKPQQALIQQQHTADRKKAEIRIRPLLEAVEPQGPHGPSSPGKEAAISPPGAEGQGAAGAGADPATLSAKPHRPGRPARPDPGKAQDRLQRLAAHHPQEQERGRTATARPTGSPAARTSSPAPEELQRLVVPADRLPGSNGSAGQRKGFPEAIPFGNLNVDLPVLAEEFSLPELDPLPARPVQMPTFLPFPRYSALVLQTHTQGKAVAVQALQALMLRFLTSLPPGKVRFTILDPVGLGENFAAFMHLADYDEALVTSRIWTEPGHIEKRLADLTLHMENVIQKYLRNQFSSIEDYNAQAGEVAEPFRVLVVANFPVNFTPQAARRLVSIVQSGASCGVYALISADVRQPLPQGFALEELTTPALLSALAGPAFPQRRPGVGPLSAGAGNAAGQQPGHRGGPADRRQGQGRQPRPGAVLVHRARHGGNLEGRQPARRDVPLGRAGAVRKLAMQLGKGTSQHVLIAGKTGSGKSTLLHALITNLALHYSPDEVELYLIDFKKGVEFKIYAEQQAAARPGHRHRERARVRPERAAAARRRAARTRRPLPRRRASTTWPAIGQRQPNDALSAHPADRRRVPGVLRRGRPVSQDSALLLDRLVRQGRAFGMHVLLGSQTLGGAYSLARSTIDQMAVRIALQCSESRRPADPEQGQPGRPPAVPARRGDLQRRVPGRWRATRSSRWSGCTDEQREQIAALAARACRQDSGLASHRARPGLREQRPGRPRPQPAAARVPGQPRPQDAGDPCRAESGPGLAGRGDRHQGPDSGGVPAADGPQPADRRPERGDGPGPDGLGPDQPGRAARTVPHQARFLVLDGTGNDEPERRLAGPCHGRLASPP